MKKFAFIFLFYISVYKMCCFFFWIPSRFSLCLSSSVISIRLEFLFCFVFNYSGFILASWICNLWSYYFGNFSGIISSNNSSASYSFFLLWKSSYSYVRLFDIILCLFHSLFLFNSLIFFSFYLYRVYLSFLFTHTLYTYCILLEFYGLQIWLFNTL